MQVTDEMRNRVQRVFNVFFIGGLTYKELANRLSIVTGKTLTRIQTELQDYALDLSVDTAYGFMQRIDDDEDNTN